MKTKLQLDKRHYVELEVTEDKLPIVEELNREFWKMTKREVRHESIYSLDELTEKKGFDVEDPTQSIEAQIIEAEDRQEKNKKLYAAIKKLNPRQKEMVHMVFFKEMSQDEVAKHFGITKSSVSDAMRRIYASLKKFLEKN